MDLNDIQLPASVIADLYRSSLIHTNTNDSSESFSNPEPDIIIPDNHVDKEWKHLGEKK